MTDSQVHTQQEDERRRIDWGRIRRWTGWGVLIFLVGAAIVRNLPTGSEEDSATPGGASPRPTSAAPGPGTTGASATTEAPTGPLAQYISVDGSQLDGAVSLVGLFEDELRVSGNANNRLISLLGLPDELVVAGGLRNARWELPGSAWVEMSEGESITLFCGDNTIRGHVGDGIVLCLSTLEEANNAAADGIGVYQFVPDDAGEGAGNWMACDSSVLSENARLEFRVNATADSPGSSAAEASPGDIINGLHLINCTAG